ncbi:MAG: site-2 protease family protein [Candidatus Bathyarchaeota archaeon]|jgi:membrane-associated protease RseP (regulator of RpoE activity)|nr:site-2 protease family protein [Candidatus Bathyarchaeota archaeon]
METEEKETKNKRIQFSFPILTIRTQIFTGIFDKLGSLRVSKIASWIALAIAPIIAGIGLYTIFSSLFVLLSTPTAGDIIGELGPATLLPIPGINPLLGPIFYGWFALIFSIAIHEGAHGIAARSLGFRVKSSGLLFFLFFPIGAFVDVDEKQIEKAKPKRALRVMAAGVGANIVIGVVCLIGLLFIMNGLTPAIEGVYIKSVEEGMPAEVAGLLPNDVFISINNIHISNWENLTSILNKKIPGEIINVTVARGEYWSEEFSNSITLTELENRTVMGIIGGDLRIKEILQFYQTITPQTILLYLIPPAFAPVPFSDTLSQFYIHGLGNQWSIVANLLFWPWLINFSLAIFNALPIYPLDGGRIFNIALYSKMGHRWNKKLISQITSAVTIILAIVIILVLFIPFI